MIFKDWQEFSKWLKTLPSDKERIDALFDENVVILETTE